jgi:hypothetical protein
MNREVRGASLAARPVAGKRRAAHRRVSAAADTKKPVPARWPQQVFLVGCSIFRWVRFRTHLRWGRLKSPLPEVTTLLNRLLSGSRSVHVLPALGNVTSMPYQSPYVMVLPSHCARHRERGANSAPCLSLNFIPAGAFLLWALQKSFSGGFKALAESLSMKECKI